MASPLKRDQLLWLLGAAALAVLFAQTWTRADRLGGIDFTTYLEAARAVQHGENPYARPLAFPYIYPPFFAFGLIPLTYVPADLALIIWFAASAGAIVWATREVLLLAYPELRARSVTPFLAALFAVSYTVLQSNVRNAQVNFIIVFFAIAALRARDIAGRAVWWALAIAIKVVPGVLAPFYLRRKEWRVCAGAAIALVALCLAPAATLGAQVVSLNREYVTSFLAGSFGGRSSGVTLSGAPLDFSLGGMLALVSALDGFWIRALGALLPVATAFAADCRARGTPRTNALAFALYLGVIPLASPKSEIHHLAFALPAAALAFGTVWFQFDRRPPLLALLGITLAAYLVALVLPAWSSALLFVSLSALTCALIVLLTTFSNPPVPQSSNSFSPPVYSARRNG